MRPSKHRRGIGAYFRMVAAMPARTAEIAEVAGIKRENVLDVLRRMHHYRIIHVSEWWAPPGGGTICEVWALGAKPDAPLPKGRTLRPRGKTSFRSGVYQFHLLLRALEAGSHWWMGAPGIRASHSNLQARESSGCRLPPAAFARRKESPSLGKESGTPETGINDFGQRRPYCLSIASAIPSQDRSTRQPP